MFTMKASEEESLSMTKFSTVEDERLIRNKPGDLLPEIAWIPSYPMEELMGALQSLGSFVEGLACKVGALDPSVGNGQRHRGSDAIKELLTNKLIGPTTAAVGEGRERGPDHRLTAPTGSPTVQPSVSQLAGLFGDIGFRSTRLRRPSTLGRTSALRR